MNNKIEASIDGKPIDVKIQENTINEDIDTNTSGPIKPVDFDKIVKNNHPFVNFILGLGVGAFIYSAYHCKSKKSKRKKSSWWHYFY